MTSTSVCPGFTVRRLFMLTSCSALSVHFSPSGLCSAWQDDLQRALEAQASAYASSRCCLQQQSKCVARPAPMGRPAGGMVALSAQLQPCARSQATAQRKGAEETALSHSSLKGGNAFRASVMPGFFACSPKLHSPDSGTAQVAVSQYTCTVFLGVLL